LSQVPARRRNSLASGAALANCIYVPAGRLLALATFQSY
jgi:hypothetical protein